MTEKTFKAALRGDLVREVPYKKSFRHMGELFVLHRKVTDLTYEVVWPDGRRETKPCKPSSEWNCSHFKTGRRVPAAHAIFKISECEEKAKEEMDRAGQDRVMAGLDKHPVLNREEPELASLFSEEQ